MLEIHKLLMALSPDSSLWFLAGSNEDGKVVSNPNIGCGEPMLEYRDSKKREFYKLGMSTNTWGISLYFFGMTDKFYLAKRFTQGIGKATITGYCVKFKSIKNLNREVLCELLKFGFEAV
jgi:hypothetical protein